MSVIICPWQGSYGFRSRIIEIMAMSIPIVTSEEAVAGMDIVGNTKGVVIAKDFDDYASKIVNLLSNKKLNSDYGSENKNFATKNYDFKNTYFLLPNSLLPIINRMPQMVYLINTKSRFIARLSHFRNNQAVIIT